MKMGIRSIFTLFFVSISLINLYSQENIIKSDEVVSIDGKTYYIHTVERKQTLYSIAKSYETEIVVIESLNPEIKQGLKSGMKLKIPYSKDYVIHYVKKKETLYAISKQYSVSTDDIIKNNPVLIQGLKYGQVLKIPLPKASTNSVKPETKINETKDTAKTIQGTKIKSNENLRTYDPEQIIDCNKPRKKGKYKIAYFVPFYANEAYKVLENNDNPNVTHYKSFVFLPFYEGALMAIDSLKKTDAQYEVLVYDIADDTVKMKEIIEQIKTLQIDIAIGPFFPKTLKMMINFAKGTEMLIISPLLLDNSILVNNPNVIQLRPSRNEHLYELFRSIAQTYPKENIILAHENNEDSRGMFDSIVNFSKDTIKNPDFKNLKIQEVAFSNFFKEDRLEEDAVVITSINPIKDKLNHTSQNIIFAFIKDLNHATDFISKLNLLHDSLKQKIVLYGLPTWKNIEKIDFLKMEKISTHISTTCFIDYKNEATKNFIRKFRTKYRTEPNDYAFLGYDFTLYLIQAIDKQGLDFAACQKNLNRSMLSTEFNFTKIPNGGWENTSITLFKIVNYEMEKVKK